MGFDEGAAYVSLKERNAAASWHNEREVMRMAPLASQLAPLVNCAKLSGGGGAEGCVGGAGGGGTKHAAQPWHCEYDAHSTGHGWKPARQLPSHSGGDGGAGGAT